MAKNNESLMRDLYDLLKTKNFKPTTQKSRKTDVVPEIADIIKFHFHVNKKDYGSMHIAIDNRRKMILFYNESSVRDVTTDWTKFIKELRTWGNLKGLGLDLEPIDKLEDYMKKREYTENLNEGYYGNRNTSYSDKTPNTVKLVIKHSKPLEENDLRYTNIEKIFVENESGERFLLPTKKPSVGHVFARHISEGGTPYDERGKHIAEMADDIQKLGGFLRATRTKQFNESVNTIVQEAYAQYVNLRETMKRMRGSRGFREYFENWKPSLMETNDTTNLESAFKANYIDPRIEKAIPILSKFNINIKEMQEVNEFATWADNIIDEDLMPTLNGQVEELLKLVGPQSKYLPLGPDGSNVLPQLKDLIEDDDLYDRIKKAASVDPNKDSRPIIIGWMSENEDDEYREILDKVDKESTNSTAMPNSAPASAPKKPVPTLSKNDTVELEETLNELSEIIKFSGLKK